MTTTPVRECLGIGWWDTACDHGSNGQQPRSLGAQYPRRGDGRKGAPIGVAMRWRQHHPCPRHHDEHNGQDQGNGQEQGRTRQMKARSPCPPRVLQGRHPRSFTALPKPLHKALSCPSHVVPKLYTKHRCLRRASLRDSPALGPDSGRSISRGSGIPSRRL